MSNNGAAPQPWTLSDWSVPGRTSPSFEVSAVKIASKAMLFVCLAIPSLATSAGSVGDTHRFVEVRGAALYTQTFGHGAPILFLHGGMVFFDNSFANQRDCFARYRTVIGLDQRGHGHSQDGLWPLSYQGMADDTTAVIEKLGVGPVDIVAHSDGANIALLVARDHPELVRRMVVAGANLRSGLSPEEAQRRSHLSPEQLAEKLHALDASIPAWVRAYYASVSPDGADHWMAMLSKCYQMWIQPVVIEPGDLRKIATPVLVMAGDQDDTSIEDTLEIYRALSNGQVMIVPGTDHQLLAKRPALVNLAIRDFFDPPSSGAPRR